MIILILILGVIGAIGYFGYREYKRRKEQREAEEASSWNIFKRTKTRNDKTNSSGFSWNVFADEETASKSSARGNVASAQSYEKPPPQLLNANSASQDTL